MENNEDLFDKYFEIQEDNSIKFTGEWLKIFIMEENLDKGMIKINGDTVELLGIFEGYIFDSVEKTDLSSASHKFVSKIPNMLSLIPSSIDYQQMQAYSTDTDSYVSVKYIVLNFKKGDTYIANLYSAADLSIANSIIDMVMKAQMPESLCYEDYVDIWDRGNRNNKAGDLNVVYNILSMIVSELVRDPKDLTKPFRLNLEKYYGKNIKNGKNIRVVDLPKYINNFTSMTCGDMKQSITVAMEQNRVKDREDTHTVVETNIL